MFLYFMISNDYYKYYILSFVIGVLHKIHDDMYDNDLYDYFNINENKLYLNELLKIMFGIGFTIISREFIFFYIWFVLINILLLFMKKSDYGVYEFTGLISSIILLPFLKWKLDDNYHYFIILPVVFFLLI